MTFEGDWTLEALGGKVEAMLNLLVAMSDRSESVVSRLAVLEATPAVQPVVTILQAMNVRAGQGLDYGIIGRAVAGSEYGITGRNSGGDWRQIFHGGRYGWIYGPLLAARDAELVEVATSISTPAPAPSATPIANSDEKDEDGSIIASGPGECTNPSGCDEGNIDK